MAFYVVLVNMPTFAHRQLGLPLDQVFMVQMAAVALMTLVIPIAGALSDLFGRRAVMLAGPSPSSCWSTRCSPGSAAPSLERLLVMQLLLCTAIGTLYGPGPTAGAEQFPTEVRSTGLALSNNLG